MLYQQERHEPIHNIDWNKDKAELVIKDIFDTAISNFDPKVFWPTHANEDSDNPCNKSIYFGASGTLWALEQISKYLSINLPFDKSELIDSIYCEYLKSPDTKEVVPSFFLGEVGILLVQYKFNPSVETENKLYQLIKDNIKNPTLEALWGAPGTMLGASFLYEWTGNTKWADLFVANADFIISELQKSIEQGQMIWTQDLYGDKIRLIGAGHGYYGNMFGILKQLKLLSQAHQNFILSHINSTSKSLAIVEDGLTNWSTRVSNLTPDKFLVQWCHGSPGVITSLESFPKNLDLDFENLLVKAGELVWQAGPLKKGVALCHGTDGNGFAFLQLYKRTASKIWLDRARKFAMHAIEQRTKRNTLFTGDLGLAMYLIACIKEDSKFPMLDYI